ncbi:cysteine desulfurase [Calidifontibacter sp. DB0510]|uniref:Cysteine desulfurase n=1 Tax=Metallococcus carri TaxID=1656884 RepID=A0A967B0D1_9MICO|nr:cysteine desulfurase family protein [Metallococcus carri]NHN55704.1 cysteine desulfurase [Metallococcus carri]NOP38607.1 cysteine desulfurase [Calidifontibacter sp. DB2511S]
MSTPAYLDHAATTAIRPEVIEAIAAQMGHLGNASSLHTAGRAARRVVEESRELIADRLGATPSEVVFTSGGTEADNLAVLGAWRQRHTVDPARSRLLVSTIEHHAVLDPVGRLVDAEGAKVDWLEVDRAGVVDAEAAAAAITQAADQLALVSMMWANNEVGTLQPVAQVAAAARERGVPFHTDAVQAVGHVPVAFGECGADLLSLSGHKIGGPQGVGALLVRRDVQLTPLTFGGGQERQLRSGTLDVASIRGLAVAVAAATDELDAERARLIALRDKLIQGALQLGLGIELSGAHTEGSAEDRLPGNVHLRVPGCDGDSLLYLLDAAGVQCSTGSACQAGVPQPSHVLLAMGYADEQARGALRLTLGHTSTEADVDAVIAALPGAVERARRAHQATAGRG